MGEVQCQEYDNAEKSLTSAVEVLNARIANLKKLETADNITKELAELDLLCKEIQKGTYKEDKDFVSIFKDTEVVQEIGIKKRLASRSGSYILVLDGAKPLPCSTV